MQAEKLSDWELLAILFKTDVKGINAIEHLYIKNKLKVVLSPNKEKCSILLQKKAKEKIDFIDNLKNKLEYIKK